MEKAMHKVGLQTLIVFALGLICGFFCKCSFWSLLALFIALVAVFIYTMHDARGLKHNQGKHFIAISAVLYFVALIVSFYAVISLVIFVIYEVFNRKSFKTMTLRLLPTYIVTLLIIVKDYFF
jgi:uncharacterized membrane protein